MLRTKVDALMAIVAACGARSSLSAAVGAVGERKSHIVAFSGGVDSSLVAAIVHRVFPERSVACLGVSASLANIQLDQARDVAKSIGIPLWECPTTEGDHEEYVANNGQSCYYCKTTLYSMINQVAKFSMKKVKDVDGGAPDSAHKPVIYNGTNADDQLDPTRLGLIAASEFNVVSPLSQLTKREVREVAKYLGLPNWNYAASPCLRSRLQFGVEATQKHLNRVELAEEFVRKLVDLERHMNMRVRFLAGNRAGVELDAKALNKALVHKEAIQSELQRLGFSGVELRIFRSGSLSGYNPTVNS